MMELGRASWLPLDYFIIRDTSSDVWERGGNKQSAAFTILPPLERSVKKYRMQPNTHALVVSLPVLRNGPPRVPLYQAIA